LSKHDNLVVDRYENIEDLISVVTEKLVNNRVIGWFQGGAEIGPRALGNRSILASPKPKWMKDHINHDIKGREWYRPFAPAVMYDHQSEIFDLDVYSPHMLVTSMVKEEWREKIPAVTHVDGSARYQSVTEENNQMFYKLIESFYNQTDVPVLLNTSFNGPHEPMVESPTDAINCFLNRNLDFLVLENYFIGRVKL
jgi:carbamoyltransferase